MDEVGQGASDSARSPAYLERGCDSVDSRSRLTLNPKRVIGWLGLSMFSFFPPKFP